MKRIAENTPFKPPATIDNPTILDEIKVAFKKIGYSKNKESNAGSPLGR